MPREQLRLEPSAALRSRVRWSALSFGTSRLLAWPFTLRASGAALSIRLWLVLGLALFYQPMAGPEVEIEAIELFQFLNASPRGLLKRGLTVKRMQNDALEQVAQRQIVKFGQGLEHLQQSLLHAHARLHSLHNKVFVIFLHSHGGTNVPRYLWRRNVDVVP